MDTLAPGHTELRLCSCPQSGLQLRSRSGKDQTSTLWALPSMAWAGGHSTSRPPSTPCRVNWRGCVTSVVVTATGCGDGTHRPAACRPHFDLTPSPGVTVWVLYPGRMLYPTPMLCIFMCPGRASICEPGVALGEEGSVMWSWVIMSSFCKKNDLSDSTF